MVPQEPLDARALYYEDYATTHAGRALPPPMAALQRDVVSRLPPSTGGLVVDIGCGQGALVELLLANQRTAMGVDRSAEQVALARARGLWQVHHGDAADFLRANAAILFAVTATDVLEHLTREEIAALLLQVRTSLPPDGVLVARVPNAVSPFGGNYRHGDVTHESWFTSRSVSQIAAKAGFAEVECYPCPPVVSGVMSAMRALVWKLFSATMKAALAVETGQVRGHIVTQNLVFVARR